MGTENTYKLSGRYLYARNGKSTIEVDAEELRRVIIAEGRQINDGTIHSLFGMSFDGIFALRNQYDLRGGPAAMTPETVRVAFAGGALPHFKGSVTLMGGKDGDHYWVNLDKLTVRGGRGFQAQAGCSTRVERRVAQRRYQNWRAYGGGLERRRSGQHGRREGEAVKDQLFDRRRAARRRDARVSIYAGSDKRRAWADRRAPHFRVERRTNDGQRRGYAGKMFWGHWCREAKPTDDFMRLHCRFCPDCGLERTTYYDRRTGAADRRAA